MNIRINTLFLLTFVLTGCFFSSNESRMLATEVALVSTSIQRTLINVVTETVEPMPAILATATSLPIVPTNVVPVLTQTSEPTPTQAVIRSFPTPNRMPPPDDWQSWPLIPKLSDTAKLIWRRGVTDVGTNPHVFSKIGDCHSFPNVFMGLYDTENYSFAEEDRDLQKAIDYYKGSFDEDSIAVNNGISVASVLTSTWSDPYLCKTGENALDCELRIHNPSVMFINLGSNWISGVEMDVYYEYLAEIIEVLISRGVLPVLTSKADNAEGGHQINQTIARAARDYDLPFYNFWRVAQKLPNHGLDPERDNIHLSVTAWNWRSFYGLQMLYQIGKDLSLF